MKKKLLWTTTALLLSNTALAVTTEKSLTPSLDPGYGWVDVAPTDQQLYQAGCEYRIVLPATSTPNILYTTTRNNDNRLFFLSISNSGDHFRYYTVDYTDKQHANSVIVGSHSSGNDIVDVNQMQQRCDPLPTGITAWFDLLRCPSGWTLIPPPSGTQSGYIFCEKQL